MANAMQAKEKKKERAKEFMKKLKSMLPMKERAGKLDTLSTLEQLVNSMRQLNGQCWFIITIIIFYLGGIVLYR